MGSRLLRNWVKFQARKLNFSSYYLGYYQGPLGHTHTLTQGLYIILLETTTLGFDYRECPGVYGT